MGDTVQVEIQFDTGMSMRDILSMPELKGYKIGDVKGILLSPNRINDILPFLHKPSSRPDPTFDPPPGSLFRGQVFGHIAVFSNKSLSKNQSLVVLAGRAVQKAEAHAEDNRYPVYEPASTVDDQPTPPPGSFPAAKQAPVSMVGFPSAAQAEKAHPQAGLEPAYENMPMDPYPTPSPEKLKRWTEIIPSSTRIIRPKYPTEPVETPENAKSRHETFEAEHDEEVVDSPPPAAGHQEPGPHDGVRFAKEANHLLSKIMDITEADATLSFEAKSDFLIELRVLKLELSKFKPQLPRITESILVLSGIASAGPHIGRLKESLRGLGLLL